LGNGGWSRQRRGQANTSVICVLLCHSRTSCPRPILPGTRRADPSVGYLLLAARLPSLLISLLSVSRWLSVVSFVLHCFSLSLSHARTYTIPPHTHTHTLTHTHTPQQVGDSNSDKRPRARRASVSYLSLSLSLSLSWMV
jgi:hypothetical protein